MSKIFKYLQLFILIGFLFQNLSAQSITKQISSKQFNNIYPLALQGDLHGVFSILDTLENNQLSKQQKAIKEKFYRRFITGNEQYHYNTDDAVVIEIVKSFHEYWKKVMLDKQSVFVADSSLIKSISVLIHKNISPDTTNGLTDIEDNIYNYCNRFLKSRGFYSNAFGKTAHLYDLFIWKNSEIITYPIKLIDDSVYVEVHFMQNFISRGWAHYATLGRSSAGGWTTRQALYAVDEVYDRNSEQFKVSYLAHEGQHFADHISFPKLKQTDLEYRAKLLELVKSKETTRSLLNKFINNGANNKNNAHAFANYYLINRLSQQIFGVDYVSDMIKWRQIEPKLIKEKSVDLYSEHTRKLNEIGNDTVASLITRSYN